MITKDLVFLDTETTGLDPRKHELLEIAAVRTTPDGLTVKGEYERRVVPLRISDADPVALNVNGYRPEEWRDAVPPLQALSELQAFAADAVIVGHNVNFDLSFLDALAHSNNVSNTWYKYKVDTVSLAWPLYVTGKIEKPSLEALETYFGYRRQQRHRALVDVRACMFVYGALVKSYTA